MHKLLPLLKAVLFVTFTILPLLADKNVAITLLDNTQNTVPDAPTFFLELDGVILECSPVGLIKKKSRKNLVEYECVQKNVNTANMENMENPDITTGQNETGRLRHDIKEKIVKGAVYTIEIPQSYVKNIEFTRFVATGQLNNRLYTGVIDKLLPAKLYISFRPKFANNGKEGGLAFRKGGSRGGFYYYRELGDELELTFQYEANIKSGESFINTSDDENSTRRLSYLSLTYKEDKILVGKYWSAYYDIAGQTDQFMAFGAQASGAYNDGSDGGLSGTGRADKMIQIRTKKANFNTSLQVQIPHDALTGVDTDYAYGVAGSVVYNGYSDIQVGGSISYGKFDVITSSMQSIGIDGDDFSSIVGLSYTLGRYGASANLSYTKNHMNDDCGIYFDGIGAELYLRYDFSDSIRLVGGGNWLIPRDDDYLGDYSIKNTIVSLQYTFGKKTFDDLVYLEVSIPHGRLANGDTSSKSVAVGMRYLFGL